MPTVLGRRQTKKEQVTTDISGQRCFASSRHSNRGSLLARMCEELLTSKKAWSSRLCALTWKVKDTKFNRSIFQLQVSALPIEEKESGSLQVWRTPDAHCNRGPSSEKRMKMKLEKKMPISINDQGSPSESNVANANIKTQERSGINPKYGQGSRTSDTSSEGTTDVANAERKGLSNGLVRTKYHHQWERREDIHSE